MRETCAVDIVVLEALPSGLRVRTPDERCAFVTIQYVLDETMVRAEGDAGKLVLPAWYAKVLGLVSY